MESENIIDNATTFDKILAYITIMEKTLHKLILLYAERNDDDAAAEELAAINEVVDLILLVVTAIQDRIGVDIAPAPAIRHFLFNDQSTQTSDVPEPVLETRDESVMVIDGEDLQDHRPTSVEDGPTACDPDGGKNDDEDLPVIRHFLFNDQSTQTSDVPEPVLETRDESVMVIDGEDLQDHRPTSVEDGPTACDPDDGKNDDEDLPAEGVVETGDPMVEDLAAVEPDRPYVAPIKMSKPRKGRSAWKSIKRAALRLCCVR